MKTNQKTLMGILFLTGFFGIACIGPSVDLNENARPVQVREDLAEEDKANFDEIKTLKCEIGTNGRPYADNKKACENKFRNFAATAGADLIIMKRTYTGANRFWGKECTHCAEFEGVVYKRKGGNNVVPVPAVVPPAEAARQPAASPPNQLP